MDKKNVRISKRNEKARAYYWNHREDILKKRRESYYKDSDMYKQRSQDRHSFLMECKEKIHLLMELFENEEDVDILEIKNIVMK